MQFEVADNGCVGYVFKMIFRYVVILDNTEGVVHINLFADALGTYANALAQAAHFFGVQSGPYGHKAWVFAELGVREGEVLASLLIEDRNCTHAE